MSAKYRWKFLYDKDGKIVSHHRNETWVPGEWKHLEGSIELCENGFHCSKTIGQAFSYIQGEVLARVEVKGKSDVSDDKECYESMRIVKAYKWTALTSVALAIFAAEQVVDIYEKYAPDDKRVRNAIEAAKKYLNEPTKANSDAAYAAADAADAAARAAAYAADAAARAAARAAADAAARAAADAARAAARAAAYAARKELIKRIDKWLTDHVKELEEL